MCRLLPEGVTVSEEYETISVKVTIEKLVERTLRIKETDVAFRNLASGYVATAGAPGDILSLTISGRASILNEIPDTAINAYVDCGGLKAGEHQVRVQLDLSDTCKITKYATIKIHITKERGGSTASSSPSPTTKPTESAAKYDVGKTERGANTDGDTFTRRMICQKLLS